MSDERDRRRFSRVRLKVEADLSDGCVSLMACETRDLSLQGVFVIAEVPPTMGPECDVSLLLSGMIEPLELNLRGRIVRRQGEGVAVQFHSCEGLECWHHLTNLVLYNSEDPDKILEERDNLLRGRSVPYSST